MKKYITLILFFLLSGCSIKDYTHTASKVFIIKSPKLKFSDLGFIRNSDKAIELELFVAGKAVKKIHINHLICVDEGCMSKAQFNKEYLDETYPDEILQNILLGFPIYDGKDKIKTADGFEQELRDEKITYKVDSKTIFFKDRKNKIIFKIKETN